MYVRYDISFTGTVQGVGFRYTTHGVAADHDVSGWVRNEPNGSVRCVVEGEADELELFVTAVQSAMAGCVADTKVHQEAATGEFDSFSIRR